MLFTVLFLCLVGPENLIHITRSLCGLGLAAVLGLGTDLGICAGLGFAAGMGLGAVLALGSDLGLSWFSQGLGVCLGSKCCSGYQSGSGSWWGLNASLGFGEGMSLS